MHVNPSTIQSSGRPPGGSSEGHAEDQPVSSVAFDMLLDSLRTAHGNRAVRRSAAREGQVFEPTPDDPREHRLKTIGDQQRAKDNRADVGVLRQSRQAGIDANQNTNRDAAASSSDQKVTAKTEPTSASFGRTLAESSSQSKAGGDYSDAQNKLTSPSLESRTTNPRGASSIEQSPIRTDVGAPSAPGRVESPPGFERDQSLARQIARVLGVPRGSETVENKASSGPPAGPSGESGRSASSRPGGRLGGASPSKQASTPGQAGPAATGKSEFERLVRSIRMRAGKGPSSVTMQLNPPKLGRMRIEARMEGNALTLSVRTQSPQARDLVQERLADLQLSLEKHGIQIERVEIEGFAPDRQDSDAQDSRTGGNLDQSHSQPEPGWPVPSESQSADETSMPLEPSLSADPSQGSGSELDIRI